MTPDAPSDPVLSRLTLACGSDVAYADEGEGLTIVAVHGLPGSHRDFRWFASAVGSRARLIRPDMPGFGLTPSRDRWSMSFGDRIQFLKAFVDALALKAPPLIVGHSIGAAYALQFAHTYPDDCRGLAMMAGPGIRPHRGYRVSRVKPLNRLLSYSVTRRLLLPILRRAFTHAGFSRNLTDNERLLALQGLAAISFHDQATALKRLTMPTFVAWADNDPQIETAISQTLADHCPSGPRLCLKGGGHNIQKTYAVELADAVMPWFSGLDTNAATP